MGDGVNVLERPTFPPSVPRGEGSGERPRSAAGSAPAPEPTVIGGPYEGRSDAFIAASDARMADLLDRFRETIERPIIHGTAIPYNQLSKPFDDGHVERIAPGAVRSLDHAWACLDHNADRYLGSVKAGTMVVRDTPQGLHYAIDPPKDPFTRVAVRKFERSGLRSSSIAFRPVESQWSELPDGTRCQTHTAIDLVHIGIVHLGHYPAATAHVTRIGKRRT